MSIFARPLRSILPATAHAQRRVEVASFDELVAAVGYAAASGSGSSSGTPFGVEIVIVKPVNFRYPVIIPPACAGLSIVSNGAMPITASGELAEVFTIKAVDVSVRGLRVAATAGGAFAGFVSIVDLPTFGRAFINDNVVDSSSTVDGDFIACTDTNAQGVIVMGNSADSSRPGGTTFVNLPARDWIVVGNVSTHGTFAVTSTGSANANVVMGNSATGGDIDTSTGTGSNTIVGNVTVGTITSHATDAVGLNT